MFTLSMNDAPQPFDFRRPPKFPAEQLRRFERIHEVFTHTCSAVLSASAHCQVDFEVAGAAQIAFDQAFPEGRTHVGAVLSVEPLGTEALLLCNAQFLLLLAERMMGGIDDSDPGQFDGELTEIERTLAERVVDVLTEALSSVWRDFAAVTFRPTSLETNLSTIGMASPNEPTLALQFTGAIAGEQYDLAVYVPWSSIEVRATHLASVHREEAKADDRAPALMHRHLCEMPVDLRAEVARIVMPLEDVVALRPGDVLSFHQPAEDGIVLYANDVPAARAIAGKLPHTRAVQMHSPMTRRSR